jgi:hypothetical protein
LPIGQERFYSLAASIRLKIESVVIDVSKIDQGTEFIAEVNIRNLKNEGVENVALSQILPSDSNR